MTTDNTSGEAEIRKLIGEWINAHCAKDLDRVMSHYAEDIIVFGVRPPFQTDSKAAWRRVWEEGLTHFPASFQIEIRDFTVAVNGDLGLAHWHMRYIGVPRDHPVGQFWLRSTVGYRKLQGRWLITHEHFSFLPKTDA